MSSSNEPADNLALERRLLSERTEDFLLLYINSPAVVVGRNQQPEAEADMEYCRRNGIPVLRRMTGGGAVYHDRGNVNWAFITARVAGAMLDSRPHGPIVGAVAEMGVRLRVGERGELLTGDGLKVSGTASYAGATRQIFHGTLLFDTDFERMRLALAGDAGARGRKVPSVPSATANLKPLLGRGGTTEEFMETLAQSITRHL